MSAMKSFSIAILLALFCISSSNLFAQEPARDLLKPNKIVFEGDMAALLAQLADLHKVNIGLETDPTQPRTWVKVDFRFATVDDLLEGIIKAAPAYRWRNKAGFIDVYPAEGGCPLLETAIAEFHVDNTDWLGATESLISLPEIAREKSALGLSRRESDNQRPQVVLFSLDLKNVSLREALHEITKTSRNSFWMFKRFGQRGQEFSISNAPS